MMTGLNHGIQLCAKRKLGINMRGIINETVNENQREVMEKMNQKECINVKFSEGLGIFNDHYRYPLIDDQETHNGPAGKVADIQGIKAHAGRNFFVPEGKEFSFDIDGCPYLHIGIKAEEGTNTCLMPAASIIQFYSSNGSCIKNKIIAKVNTNSGS